MLLEFVAIVVLCISLLIISDKISKHNNGKQLPGPIDIPILGSFPHILLKVNLFDFYKLTGFEVLEKLKKIWGSPMQLKLGIGNTVIIDDLKMIRKIMSSEDWADRAPNEPLWWYERSFNKHLGLLLSNGEGWKEMRRNIHKNLTKFGFGRSQALEMHHEEEIKCFFDFLDKKIEENNGIINMQNLFLVSSLNILWGMVAGGTARFSYDSPELHQQIKLLEEFANVIHPREILFLGFPWLRHFPFISGFSKAMNSHIKLQEFFRKFIRERKAKGEYKEVQENFVDAFLLQMDINEEQNIQPNYYTEEQLIMVMLDLFLTGFVPVGSCLEFLIMYMILHPEIQKKCHEEIDTVVGKSRYPSINDNEKCQYTQAVCLEVLRKVVFIPITMRSSCRDTYINERQIPKGTIALINLYNVHHDPEIWNEPEKFIPERFIGDDGLVNTDTILPFGVGKRVCPAEVFARASSFTYFTYLLQRYSFEIPPGHPPPDSTPRMAMGSYPKQFYALIKRRV